MGGSARHVRDVDGLLRMLDTLFPSPEPFWDHFYEDRDRDVPFFVAKPDESLVSFVDAGVLRSGRALDLGCGPGRNAAYLASKGFDVEAVDLSAAAIAWARERAPEVRFRQGDVFTTNLTGPYDLLYDSGCFHHLPPHRRISYLDLVDRLLAPGGHLAMSCFAAGAERAGTAVPDDQLYRDGAVHGGLAFTSDELRAIFTDLTPVEIRRMRAQPPGSPTFGEDFLHVALFRR
ncbi:class I SAM-dependent methyltransferase [Saccharopolyspora rhizosphaerae]|uniref:Class I SAM-dependent methyltransferase n=1 Tax=Saccharopolyspora rhizosphaerae TaxID=2492662 RepID=A0A426JIZ8_9PSEU|nr:class I SAM-dependent methyltransferase [Saccharopolyspora rhizosphaerae]RRO13138.1 class I SAM-dependent methyltransferase [Saccharopolyspora rhizosphaerae]